MTPSGVRPSGRSHRVERGFALLAAVVLVLSVVAAVTIPTQATRDKGIAFDADVPDEYSFTPPTDAGTATVDGESFDSVQAAVDAADPGDTVVLSGIFEERVVVDTPDVTLTSAPGPMALINGTGEGDVLTLNGENVTLDRVWVSNSGYKAENNDAAIWVNGTNATIANSRVTEMTFGIWIDGVNDVLVENNTIVGRERVRPLSYRGNGIQLWKTEGTFVDGNRITDVRDGLYYSWASNVDARGNTMWDLRYGVHYMYSDSCELSDNVAFDNDVGYALMVSEDLSIHDNVAVNNSGTSGHGLLLERIDHSSIRDNTFVANRKGLYVFNSVNNTIVENLVLSNDVGVHVAAGSFRERVYGNSFIHNKRPLVAVVSAKQLTWNATDRQYGNYWDTARTSDADNDGVSEIRYRPSGLVEWLTQQHPQALVFANSPAFDAIRMAESSFPVIESPGVIDYYPLTRPNHEDWREYYE
ncbi:nitrous oxide reductase family maturation protein NosD [Halobacteriaceae archaeon GCM10025711]